jgi:hypothetical protein
MESMRRGVFITGLASWLEGAQPLLDMAVALRLPELKSGEFILSLAVTPHGLAGAALVQKLQPPARDSLKSKV